MRQLVRQQSLAFPSAGNVLAAQRQYRCRRYKLAPLCSAHISRPGVRMNAHPAEVATEARFKIRAHVLRERFPVVGGFAYGCAGISAGMDISGRRSFGLTDISGSRWNRTDQSRRGVDHYFVATASASASNGSLTAPIAIFAWSDWQLGHPPPQGQTFRWRIGVFSA